MNEYEKKLERINEVRDALETMKDIDLVRLWNWQNFAEEARVYPMSKLDTVLKGIKPSEMFNIFDTGLFSVDDKYFSVGYDGGLYSFNDYTDSMFDLTELAEYVVDDMYSYGFTEIQDVFDKWEKEAEYDSMLKTLSEFDVGDFNKYVLNLDGYDLRKHYIIALEED